MILDIVFIIIPIALIILLTIDFSKAVVSGDEGAQSKSFKLGMKRLLYAVIVFFVPTIVSIVNVVLGELGVDYSVCYNDITITAIERLEAEEIAIEEAENAARLALLEEQRKKAEEDKEIEEIIDSSGTYLPSGSGCDGYVYYENGTFYKSNDSSLNGTVGSNGSAFAGYNKYFYVMLTKMVEDAKAVGYTITPSPNEGDGAWRSLEKQQYYYNCYQTKKCNSGNPASYPGTSRHGWGIAFDLKYGSSGAITWAHNNAYRYGLKFTVSSENWHIEPASQKVDESVVSQCK